MNASLQPVISELHKAFNLLNSHFFNGELPQVVITIQSQGKRSCYGWFTVAKVWSSSHDKELHEINISAEHIGSRKMIEVLQTLLHEMLHLYASENEIQDTSRSGGYHNKRFKQIAEEHGMSYNHDKPNSKIGYSAVELTNESIATIESWNLKEASFDISRLSISNVKKKSNIVKWVCGCNVIVRSSKPVINVICGDCETHFIKQETESE